LAEVKCIEGHQAMLGMEDCSLAGFRNEEPAGDFQY
jgi:hypothetical protein